MSAPHHSIHEGSPSNVQGNKAFPPEPLHDPSCEGRHDLFYCVCPRSVLFHAINLTTKYSFLVWSLLDILYDTTNIIHGGWSTILLTLEFIPPFTLVPRFILSLRALYVRDLRGIRGGDMDTAFGFTSGSGHGTVGTIMFADAAQSEGAEQEEEIQMEERARETHSAGSSV